MAKKKIIKKKKAVTQEEKLEEKETKVTEEENIEEEIDAFEGKEEQEEEEEEASEVEKEIFDENEFDEEIIDTRVYVVPLARKGYEKGPKWNRAKKAIKTLRKFVERHMKPTGPVYISQELNERIWENGIKNPPRKIKVSVTKSKDGIVRVFLK